MMLIILAKIDDKAKACELLCIDRDGNLDQFLAHTIQKFEF